MYNLRHTLANNYANLQFVDYQYINKNITLHDSETRVKIVFTSQNGIHGFGACGTFGGSVLLD